MNSELTVIVPVRGLDGGKTRLAGLLPAGERRELVRVMARRVLDAAVSAGVADRVVLLTRDAAYAAGVLRDMPGIDILLQPDTIAGLNNGLEFARRERPAEAHLVLFADLPLIEAHDVQVMVSSRADVTIGRDRHGTGTNALLLRGDRTGEFRFAFGSGSHARHVETALRMGLDVDDAGIPNLRFDLDTVDDWFDAPSAVRADLAARIGMTGVGTGSDSLRHTGIEGERDAG